MSAQPFERYPALASWIERLGNTPGVLPLGDWMVFVGALNNALTRAEGPAPVSAPLDREAIARVIETTYWPLVDKWGRNTSNEYWNTRIEASLAKADAILALSQQDQVGLTTPAVLGEPSAEAWIEWKGGENPAPGMTVDVALANGSHQLNRSADSLIWEPVKVLPFSAVIAYRVVSPPPPAGGVK